jgi:cytochrome c553
LKLRSSPRHRKDASWASALPAFLVTVILLPVPAATAAVAERLAPCLACHGDNGQSTVTEVPSLGGQPVFYLSVQLYMFRAGMRNIEPMPAMMKGLGDDELARMAQEIAKLPSPSPTPDLADPARFARARGLIQQHRCNFCHKQDFSGEEGAPRLAAQREDYLIKAMREYKSNVRRAYDPSMADVMHPISDDDILDLAHYLARLR